MTVNLQLWADTAEVCSDLDIPPVWCQLRMQRVHLVWDRRDPRLTVLVWDMLSVDMNEHQSMNVTI